VLEEVISGFVTFSSLPLASNHFVHLAPSRFVVGYWGVAPKVLVVDFDGQVSNLDLLRFIAIAVISVLLSVISGKVELSAKFRFFESRGTEV
jgi:hypothetical protein